MKILHIHTSMAGGGVQAVITSLVNEMSLYHDVSLCTIFKPCENDVFENKILPSVKRYNLGKRKSGISLRMLFKILNFIKNNDSDIVHVHGYFYYYILAIFLLHNKKKFIYTVHSDAKMENTRWDKLLMFFKRYAFKKRFLHPVTISHESQKSFYEYYNINSTLIYNGIPKPKIRNIDVLKQYRFSPHTKIFLHPGRITEAKNQIVLCRAFKKLLDRNFDVCLIIAGSQQDLNIYNQLQEYFCDRIVYVGEQSDIPQMLYNADAMCLPSIWEGMPMVLIEALSVGCIPICSPVGGIVNVVTSGINGFLSLDSSVDSYYKALLDYINLDNSKRSELKERCLKSYEPFNITKIVEVTLEFYNNLLYSRTTCVN